jgi:hypothetical protein
VGTLQAYRFRKLGSPGTNSRVIKNIFAENIGKFGISNQNITTYFVLKNDHNFAFLGEQIWLFFAGN